MSKPDFLRAFIDKLNQEVSCYHYFEFDIFKNRI